MVVQTVDNMKFKTGLPVRRVCAALQVPWASYGRWRGRLKAGVAAVGTPGPGKLQPPDMEAIRTGVQQLNHGVKRSGGTGVLYQMHRQSISRRELAALVVEARQESNRQRREQQSHLSWHRTGVVWSMDATELPCRSLDGRTVYVTQFQELCSRYKLSPLGGSCPVGEEIAGHLDHQFRTHEPPLFLKRDNGGNMNHMVVDDVLAEYCVLPLNGPFYYAPYNGAIEHGQGEMKRALDLQLCGVQLQQTCHIEPYARGATQELNHMRRDVLNGHTACQVFHDPTRAVRFTKTKRKKIYELISERRNHIIAELDPIIPWAAHSLHRIPVSYSLATRLPIVAGPGR
jgi:hypothetical protein